MHLLRRAPVRMSGVREYRKAVPEQDKRRCRLHQAQWHAGDRRKARPRQRLRRREAHGKPDANRNARRGETHAASRRPNPIHHADDASYTKTIFPAGVRWMSPTISRLTGRSWMSSVSRSARRFAATLWRVTSDTGASSITRRPSRSRMTCQHFTSVRPITSSNCVGCKLAHRVARCAVSRRSCHQSSSGDGRAGDSRSHPTRRWRHHQVRNG